MQANVRHRLRLFHCGQAPNSSRQKRFTGGARAVAVVPSVALPWHVCRPSRIESAMARSSRQAPDLCAGVARLRSESRPHSSRHAQVEEYLVYNELECYGGPLDGQTVRLRTGQFEVMIPFSARAAGGARRFAVYSIRRKRVAPRPSSPGAIDRPLYVLMFIGEEWRVS